MGRRTSPRLSLLTRLAATAFLALAAQAVTASPAGAAVLVGTTFTPTDVFGTLGAPGTLIQSGSPANSYTVPTNGVITSWSFRAAAGTTPPLKLKVVRPAGGDDFTTVGDSQLATPTASSLNTWPARISVKAGDLIGHGYTNDTVAFRTASGFNTHELCCSDPVLDPPAGTTATYRPNTDIQIDVSSILEPDADQDGFGDESQDQCPTNGSTQGTCPATGQRAAALKKCKKKFRHNKAKRKKCKRKANLLPL
jgi:hypothetical protein